MGCGQVASKNSIHHHSDRNHFTVHVHNPNTLSVDEYVYKSKTSNLSLPVLMNYLCFDPSSEKNLDGNFISIYDKEKDCFSYWVERLVGVSVTDSKNPMNSKNWVVYVNTEKKLMWDEIVRDDFNVGWQDRIDWVFQLAEEDKKAEIEASNTRRQ